MHHSNAKPRNASRWVWARTAALILFAVTGILFVASLHSTHGQATKDGMGADMGADTGTIETRLK